jgi:isoleucyl-tRNA synthetase
MYAEVDDYEWDGKLDDPMDSLTNPLDKWVVSRVHQLTKEVGDYMDRYDIPNALEPVLPFLEDASNWYVRRSRRRFWKSEDDSDKKDAYRTLHYVLVRLSMVMAPFTPFLAEELFLKLTGGQLGESVHLLDWPEVGKPDDDILNEMRWVREVINEGLRQRAAASVKVRQPLAALKLTSAIDSWEAYKDILLEELNVKGVIIDSSNEQSVVMDTELTQELRAEGLMREVIRVVQNARKEAGLNVDDRITLSLTTNDSELAQAIKGHKDTIQAETLATGFVEGQELGFKSELSVEGKSLVLSLQKAQGIYR